ncbi:MAG TPA: hypothetical protein VKU44_00005 [Terriglobia bacterium]|nr:hypothetical protein [Terriglobia bacterium]
MIFPPGLWNSLEILPRNDDLPGQRIDVNPSIAKYPDSMVTIEYRSVRPHLQRISNARQK